MAAPEEDFSQLPLDERLVHKIWKVRLGAYEELAKVIRRADPDSEAEFRPYYDMMKKLVVDSNAVAQEMGLTAVLAFVESAPNSERIRHDVISGLIEKCMNSSRTGTKTKTLEILLALVEVDTAEPVVEDLLPGFDHKQPKVIVSCVSAAREMIKQYGHKTIGVKPIVKTLAKLFGHSDKNVRAEATALTVELYRWIGSPLMSQLSDLKPVQLKELEALFAALPEEKPTPTRYLRSQQAAMAAAAASATQASADGVDEGPAEEENDAMDDLIDPVDVLEKMDPEFFNWMASTKWKERKEALEALLEIVKTPKILDNRYGDLVTALAKRIGDANIICATLAVNCIEALALGLRQNFAQYKPVVVPPLIEKLKEKKQNVVDALRASLDAVTSSVSISDILEDVGAGSKHKNPNVKAESVRWLLRTLKNTRTPPSKPEVKGMCEMLVKLTDDSQSDVREASFEALGTLMKAAGERAVNPFLEGIDSIKEGKIKEFYDKAEVKVIFKPAIVSKPAPPPAKSKAPPKPKADAPKAESKPAAEAKSTAKPATAKPPASTAPAAKKKTAAPVASAALAKKGPKKDDEPLKYRFSSETAEEQFAVVFPASVLSQIVDSNWKNRLAGMEEFHTFIESSIDEVEPELVVRQLAKKPGWKDSNFQVLSKSYGIIELLATKSSKFSKACGALSIPALIEKLGDIKLKKPAGDCMMAMAERISLQFVLQTAYEPWKKQKAPKVIADSLVWIQTALNDFGIGGLAVRDLIDFLKFCLANTNAAVRNNAVSTLGVVRLFAGPSIRSFVEDLNPTLLVTIDAEFAKVAELEPPKPAKAAEEDNADVMEELFPRVDISPQLAKLVSGIGDSNWKVRKENMDSVIALIEASKRIKPTIGDLMSALKPRLADNNKALVVLALDIVKALANAMGKPFDKHFKAYASNILSTMTDSKPLIRAATVTCMDQVAEAIGFDTLVPHCATALATDSPHLRIEMFKWLDSKIGAWPGDGLDLSSLLTPVLTCLQDRNVDVRKGAQGMLKHLAENVGFEKLRDKCRELKGPSVAGILAMVDDLRATSAPAANAASRPPTSQKASSEDTAEPTTASETKGKTFLKRKGPVAASAPTKAPAAVEISQTPILSGETKPKELRAEKDRGLARWTFDAPRKEHLDLLSDQMAPHFSADIHKRLFSTDHHREREFMAALTSLDECLANTDINEQKYNVTFDEMKIRYIANSDLLLKYLTIRFFDTGTTMLIKCLDLLEHLVELMRQEGYRLMEYEASLFLPVFINKLGENKDVLRARVRTVMRRLSELYPPSKMFAYIETVGLKSKNSRTRSESLDELGYLIQTYGLTVCTPTKSFPVIASHIGDRDSSVRNAAINALLQAYLLSDEIVFKQIGRISEKDKSMLQEKFRRSKPPPPPEPEKEEETVIKFSFQKQQRMPEPLPEVVTKEEEPIEADVHHEENVQRAVNPSRFQPLGLRRPTLERRPPVSGISAPRAIEDAAEDGARHGMPDEGATEPARPVQRSFAFPGAGGGLRRPVARPPQHQHVDPQHQEYERRNEHAYDERQSALPVRPIVEQKSRIAAPSSRNKAIPPDMLSSVIDNGDSIRSIVALKQLETFLSTDASSVSPYMDQLVKSITLKSHLALTQTETPENVKLCKHLINCLVQMFSNPELAITVKQAALGPCIEELLVRLLDKNLQGWESGPQLVRALNMLMMRVLDNAEKNGTISTLIHMLQTSSLNLRTFHGADLEQEKSLVDLIMKCLWKLTKTTQSCLKAGTLQATPLLADLHNFFVAITPSEWKRRVGEKVPLGDMPLRTVKTMIHEVKIALGDGILDALPKNIDSERSYLYIFPFLASLMAIRYTYILHLMDAGKKKHQNVPSKDSTSEDTAVANESVPAATPDGKLTETELQRHVRQIFMRISSREHTKDGIRQLYDFQQEHPEAQEIVQNYLESSGQHFKQYIKRSLTNIAHERGDATQATGTTTAPVSASQPSLSNSDPDAQREKLLKLQQTFGYDQAASHARRSSVGHRRLTLPGDREEAGTDDRRVASADMGHAETLIDLRARLARMKRAVNGES